MTRARACFRVTGCVRTVAGQRPDSSPAGLEEQRPFQLTARAFLDLEYRKGRVPDCGTAMSLLGKEEASDTSQ